MTRMPVNVDTAPLFVLSLWTTDLERIDITTPSGKRIEPSTLHLQSAYRQAGFLNLP
jgi:hypothetical protein